MVFGRYIEPWVFVRGVSEADVMAAGGQLAPALRNIHLQLSDVWELQIQDAFHRTLRNFLKITPSPRPSPTTLSILRVGIYDQCCRSNCCFSDLDPTFQFDMGPDPNCVLKFKSINMYLCRYIPIYLIGTGTT